MAYVNDGYVVAADSGSESSGDEAKHTYRNTYQEYKHEEEVEEVRNWDKFRQVNALFFGSM